MFISRLPKVVILAYLFILLSVAGRQPPPFRANAVDFEQPLERKYMLYHQFSERHVRVTYKHVRARNTIDPYSVLVATTEGKASIVSLRGQKSSAILCINKKGKLIVRKSGHHDKKCQFREILTDTNYTEFQSTYNGSIYMGFNKSGKPLRNLVYHEHQRVECFRFQKNYDLDSAGTTKNNNHNGISSYNEGGGGGGRNG